jgi:PIN domain nuclease of toxin-antitoxin system
MRLSLDTHIALWALVDSPRLSKRARALIEAPSNTIVISAVVLWEIAIKYTLNRGDAGDMPLTAKRARAWFQKAGYAELEVGWDDAVHCASLPALHGDPFDRMLIAQTFRQDVWLLTADAKILAYGGNLLSN